MVLLFVRERIENLEKELSFELYLFSVYHDPTMSGHSLCSFLFPKPLPGAQTVEKEISTQCLQSTCGCHDGLFREECFDTKYKVTISGENMLLTKNVMPEAFENYMYLILYQNKLN